MCGITVELSPRRAAESDSEPSLDVIEKMTRSLAHRGPDATGSLALPGVRLGHRRLSIIDVSGGAQPMADPSLRYFIVFNGEIYNFRELRRDLESRGHTFTSHSDTEVLMQACIEFGDKVPERLNGQFAFAIWDNAERKLFAARDRMGEKPLFWAQTSDGRLLIASEIKSLLASGLIEPRIDRASIDAYLTLLYLPPDQTVYENVHALRPAHAMVWQNDTFREWRYWEPKYSTGTISDPREAVEEIRRLLEQAVHRQMVADVPVGAFLSGGLDSSSIVAYMARHSSIPIQTFSVGFGDMINELPYARQAAKLYNTDHHELQMSMPLGELLDRMMDVYDEPFGDSSNIPTFCVANFASKSVKVVLSGDGGDELFGGYWWNKPRLDDLRTIANPPNIFALGAKALAWRALAKLHHGMYSRWHRSVALYNDARDLRTNPDLWERNLNTQSFINRADRQELWGGGEVPDMKSRLGSSYFPESSMKGMDRVVDFDIRCYLPGDILMKVDRAAMANSLETRAPFLDVDLVEFVLGIPWETRFAGSQSKPLLHQACDELLPESLRTRSKQGFGAPVKQWMKLPEIDSRFRHATRTGGPLNDLLPGLPRVVNRVGAYRQWILMCLGLWLEKHS